MATLKNNPYDLLEKEKISKKLLSDRVLKGLSIFDETLADMEQFPTDKKLKKEAEEIGKETIELVKEDIERIKEETHDEIEENSKKEIRKVQSKKVVEKAEKVLDDLSLCRQKLKEDRQRKIESGEIQPPKKKTLVTKLRQELVKTATLIPQKLKEDSDVIQRTQKAVLNFLNELKSIWGLNKIKPIQDEIKEKFKKLEEKAEAA
ncbi:MAG: hypothetical protein A3F72_20055 [Bacteroidetes bacterium RIFCSPLOWO2_12_FULL_35_15]|nr:MAG: hypothetical protein A3F72_20055 [Bacteroidetes bacterium RIFCSPLOWO2_12_FULL_35_15]